MKHLPTKQELVNFEAEIAEIYNRGEIKAPVHLSGGNEDALLDIFADVDEGDWVFSTWRSHYHCLLKGVPRDQLKADILCGHSITLSYPEQRVFTSAIVGGTLPIALGVAWALKRKCSENLVWCFIGDMAANSGAAHEAFLYASGHGLPLRIIIEDNDMSVGTPTRQVWGDPRSTSVCAVDVYRYQLKWPHAGAGKWINF